MTIDTTRLRALLEAVTPGPWAWYGAEQLGLPMPRSTRLRVTTVWYEQPTARAVELGRASIRIGTDVGHFHRDVPLSVEGLNDARSVAKLCGVDLVIALDLRELVAGWGGEHA